MLAEYSRKSKIGGVVFLSAFVGSVLATLASVSWPEVDVLGHAIASAASVTFALSFWYAMWALAKAKGYGGHLGVLLGFFLVFGLALLLLIRDQTAKAQASNQVQKSPGQV